MANNGDDIAHESGIVARNSLKGSLNRAPNRAAMAAMVHPLGHWPVAY